MDARLYALVLLGLACLIAAAVGGGLRVGGTTIPPIASKSRQVMLAWIGIAIIVLAYVLGRRDDGGPDRPAAALPAACAAEIANTKPNDGAWSNASLTPETFDVHSHPSAIAASDRAVWIAHEDGKVTRIRATDAPGRIDPLRQVQLGRARRDGSVSIAASGTGAWASKAERGAESGVVAQISYSSRGAKAQPRAFPQPDNVAAFGGAAWITSDAMFLVRVEPVTFASDAEVGDQHAVNGDPHGLWAGAECVYVATTKPSGYQVFGADARPLMRFAVHGDANEITAGAGALWLVDVTDRAVLRIDPKHPDKATSTPLGVKPAGDVLAAGSSGAWTADGKGAVVWLDPSGKLKRRLDVPGGTVALAIQARPTEEIVWVVLYDDHQVRRIVVHRGG